MALIHQKLLCLDIGPGTHPLEALFTFTTVNANESLWVSMSPLKLSINVALTGMHPTNGVVIKLT